MSWLLTHINPLYSASGFAVGLLVGFTGVGGGSLMTPLLVLLFGIHPATAVGTDLLYAGLTKISGSLVHSYNKAVDWRVVGLLASGSAPAAALTLWALSHFGANTQGANAVISTTLGFMLLATAVTLLFRRWVLARMSVFLADASARKTSLLTVALGVALGVLVTISENVHRPHRRHRHRPRGAAHPDRRRRPLVDRLGRLGAARLVAHRLDPRHRRRQPFRFARSRPHPAAADGGDAGAGRRQAGVLRRGDL